MTRRSLRQGRRFSAAPKFAPPSLPNCDLWLRADLGLTTADAAVASPSDISTGSWSSGGSSSITASKFTESVDGAPASHYFLQSVPGLIATKLAKYIVGLPAQPNGGGRYVYITPNGGGSAVGVDTFLGTIFTHTADCTNITYVGGVVTFDCLTSSSQVRIYTHDGSGISYTGDGTHYIQLGDNGLGAYITVTQKNISAWADQSGNAHHVTQGTAANQPVLITPSDGNGCPAVHGDGAQILQSASVNWSGVTGVTVFQVFKCTGGTYSDFFKGTPSVNGGFGFRYLGSTYGKFQIQGASGTNYNVLQTADNAYPPNSIPYLASITLDATQAQASENRLWVQGFEEPLTIGGGTDLSNFDGNTPYSVCSSGGGVWNNGDIYEIIVYKRVLSTAERRQVELYLASRYNILTDQRPMDNPKQLVGNVLWLDASLGITTVDAAVVSPTDFTNAGVWTPLGATVTSAHTITEDTSTGIHVATQAAATMKTQGNHAYHVRAEVPAASGNGRYVLIYSGTGGDGVFLDTQAGAISGTLGTVTNPTYVGGVLDYDSVAPAAGTNIYVSTWDGVSGGITFTGNGARTATCTRIDVTQRNVSAWADQSGNGNSPVQATGASQPLYVAAAQNGLPALQSDGVDDEMLKAFTLNQPSHMFAVAKANVDTPDATLLAGNAVSQGRLRNVTGKWYLTAGLQIGPSATGTLAWHVVSAKVDNANGTIAVDGTVEVTGAVGANNPGGVRLFSEAGGAARIAAYMSAVIEYSRGLSRAEEKIVTRYLGSRYAIAVS